MGKKYPKQKVLLDFTEEFYKPHNTQVPKNRISLKEKISKLLRWKSEPIPDKK